MSENPDTKYVSTAINGKNPSIFDFLRMKGENVYPTDDLEVYASCISKMNLGDLQTHAMDKGIKPSPDRRKLETHLINQFKAITAKRKANHKSRKMTAEEIQRLEIQRQKSIERNGFLRTRS